MSPRQYLRNFITNFAAKETTESLQARLNSAGLKTDLSSVAAEEVSEAFINAMSTLLERPISELTPEQIHAITAEVKATNVPSPTAPSQPPRGE